jgi:hypothetical protein
VYLASEAAVVGEAVPARVLFIYLFFQFFDVAEVAIIIHKTILPDLAID